MVTTRQLRSSSILIFALILGAPMLGRAQAAVWNGWARCELQTAVSGYSNHETHTWMISNITGNTPSNAGPGNWSVAGSGSLYRSDGVTSERAEWSVGGSSTGGRFVVQVSSGVATIRPVHGQLTQSNGKVGYSQQSISGQPRTPTTFSGTAWEWTFPTVQGPAAGQTISGSSVSTSTPPWGYQQPYGSTMSVNCQWSFADGSVPAPPPAVNPPPPPTPPSQQPPPPVRTAAELAWTGFVECEASAGSLSTYQETQVHRWELRGATPVSAGGLFEHRVEWKVKGSGSTRNRQETATWTTSGNDKSAFTMFIRASDGMLVIQPAQPPRVIAGGLRGTRQSTRQGAQPVPISFDAWELPFPAIVADPKFKGFKGKSSSPLTANLSRLQPTNSTGTSACRWDFRPSAP